MVDRRNTTSVISLPIRLDVLVCLLLVWATLTGYWQVKDHEFVNYDDDTYVTENHHYTKVGLKMIDSGNLLFSPLPLHLHFALLGYERFFAAEGIENRGIGAWKYGRIITKAIEFILTTYNDISIA